jgi:DGQHR domain-containing protein
MTPKTPSVSILTVPAMKVRQTESRTLYAFSVEGKRLFDFAAVSRIRRNDDSGLEGYQRPRILKHIKEIENYLDSDDPMIPNALVVAFDSRVKFVANPNADDHSDDVAFGRLEIPIPDQDSDESLPGWLVDGQQRASAFQSAKRDNFRVCVTAFITDNSDEQRSQFILVNATKPLPKGLIHELLPSTQGHLPTLLDRKRFPAMLLEQLNHRPDSPLFGLIRTPTSPDGVIKDNSILRVIENSLTFGFLHRYRDPLTGMGDLEAMIGGMSAFWAAVAEVFSDSWAMSPRQSRLMHGVGIISMGFIMDAIADRFPEQVPTQADFTRDLLPISDGCHWTRGEWDFGPAGKRRWDDLQNTGKEIQLLANHLLLEYKQRVWAYREVV